MIMIMLKWTTNEFTFKQIKFTVYPPFTAKTKHAGHCSMIELTINSIQVGQNIVDTQFDAILLHKFA